MTRRACAALLLAALACGCARPKPQPPELVFWEPWNPSIVAPSVARFEAANPPLRVSVRQVPLEHLLLETDSPYGAPQSHRGKRNEPAYVAEAAMKVAEIKGLPVEHVAELTTANALALLGLEVAATARTGKDRR